MKVSLPNRSYIFNEMMPYSFEQCLAITPLILMFILCYAARDWGLLFSFRYISTASWIAGHSFVSVSFSFCFAFWIKPWMSFLTVSISTCEISRVSKECTHVGSSSTSRSVIMRTRSRPLVNAAPICWPTDGQLIDFLFRMRHIAHEVLMASCTVSVIMSPLSHLYSATIAGRSLFWAILRSSRARAVSASVCENRMLFMARSFKV